jgi:peptidoglycan/LPS O-acetylase OafA/YrhL
MAVTRAALPRGIVVRIGPPIQTHDRDGELVVSDAPKPTPRLDSLTGMRFLAALAVFGYHVSFLFSLPRWSSSLLAPGPVGVSFFFILSGFVLTWSHPANDRPKRFYQRRFARIAPNHVVTWIMALGVLAVEGRAITASTTLPSLALVQAWVPNASIYFGANGVAWSLACEAFFYALFPLILLTAVRMPARRRPAIMVGAVMAILLLAVASRVVLSGPARLWFPYIFPPARLPEFLLGVLLALEVRDGRWPYVPMLPAVVCAAAAYAIAGWVNEPFRWISVTVVPFVVLIGSAAHADLKGRPSLFRARGLVVLGVWSYAFYLLHQLLLRLAQVLHVGGGPAHALLWTPILLAITVGSAALLFVLVERPLERGLRPRVRSRDSILTESPPLIASPSSCRPRLRAGPWPRRRGRRSSRG